MGEVNGGAARGRPARIEHVLRGERAIDVACDELASRVEEAENLLWLPEEGIPSLADAITDTISARLEAARGTLENLTGRRASARRLAWGVRELIRRRLDQAEDDVRGGVLDLKAWQWELVRGTLLPEEFGRSDRAAAENVLRGWGRLCAAVLPEEYCGQPGVAGRPARAAIPAPTAITTAPEEGRKLPELVARADAGYELWREDDGVLSDDEGVLPVQSGGNHHKDARTVNGVAVAGEKVSLRWRLEVEPPASLDGLRPPTRWQGAESEGGEGQALEWWDGGEGDGEGEERQEGGWEGGDVVSVRVWCEDEGGWSDPLPSIPLSPSQAAAEPPAPSPSSPPPDAGLTLAPLPTTAGGQRTTKGAGRQPRPSLFDLLE